MCTRPGTVGTLQWMIIDFILRLKRQLWTVYVKWLGQSVGLVEHELLSIVATATKLLAAKWILDPEIGWWEQFTMSMWLDVLLHESVVFAVTVCPGKRQAFLAAIKAQHTSNGRLSVTFESAQATFQMWFFDMSPRPVSMVTVGALL